MDSYLLVLDNDRFYVQDRYLCLLSETRRQKIAHYRYDVDKKLSFLSELLIRAVLSHMLHISPQEIILKQDDNGKPYADNDADVSFSLSHTRTAVFCAVSHGGQIGVDIERICDYLPDVMHYVGHLAEIELIEKLPDSMQASMFYKIWTRKEAYGKKNGLGICQDLKIINTLESKAGKQFISWKEGNYMCSLCTEQLEQNQKHTLTEEMLREKLQTFL